MTSVASTTSAAATAATTSKYSLTTGTGTAADKTSLGNSDFLQLLVKQLQYQDPTAPMDSNAVMQQTATLSSTQSMQSMTEAMNSMTQLAQEQFGLQMRLGASALVGQQATYLDADGTAVSGTVDSTSFATDTPTLSIGGKAVSLDAVTGVNRAASSTSSSTATASTAATTA